MKTQPAALQQAHKRAARKTITAVPVPRAACRLVCAPQSFQVIPVRRFRFTEQFIRARKHKFILQPHALRKAGRRLRHLRVYVLQHRQHAVAQLVARVVHRQIRGVRHVVKSIYFTEIFHLCAGNVQNRAINSAAPRRMLPAPMRPPCRASGSKAAFRHYRRRCAPWRCTRFPLLPPQSTRSARAARIPPRPRRLRPQARNILYKSPCSEV